MHSWYYVIGPMFLISNSSKTEIKENPIGTKNHPWALSEKGVKLVPKYLLQMLWGPLALLTKAASSPRLRGELCLLVPRWLGGALWLVLWMSKEQKWYVPPPGQNTESLMQDSEFSSPCGTVTCNSRWRLLCHPGSLRKCHEYGPLAYLHRKCNELNT